MILLLSVQMDKAKQLFFFNCSLYNIPTNDPSVFCGTSLFFLTQITFSTDLTHTMLLIFFSVTF